MHITMHNLSKFSKGLQARLFLSLTFLEDFCIDLIHEGLNFKRGR